MQRAVTTVLVERDNVAQVRLSIVNQEFTVLRTRGRRFAQLISLRSALTREAKILDQRAAAAAARAAQSSGGVIAAPGSCANTPFVAHGGPYGFFPAAGTNYSVGVEPIIAARLPGARLRRQGHALHRPDPAAARARRNRLRTAAVEDRRAAANENSVGGDERTTGIG